MVSRLVIFAGPNGSGKSSITKTLQAAGVLDGFAYVNADEIAASLREETPSRDTAAELDDLNREAMRIADRRRQQLLDEKQNFAFETVFSHPSKVRFIRNAKSADYHTTLYFVGTEDPAINVARVALRVELGGHDVPTAKIISRYERSLQNLREALEIADDVHIFDNSKAANDGRGAFRLAYSRTTNEDGSTETYIDEDPPHWVVDITGHKS